MANDNAKGIAFLSGFKKKTPDFGSDDGSMGKTQPVGGKTAGGGEEFGKVATGVRKAIKKFSGKSES